MSKFLYHVDPYQREVDTHVTAAFEEEGRHFVVLQDCLFYPQGGGQKGDIGVIEMAFSHSRAVDVVDTVKDQCASDQRPLLVLADSLPELEAGTPVRARLDWDRRYRQMRLHSAVHLHHCVMERLAGHHIPHPRISDILEGEAFNLYEGSDVDGELVDRATDEFRSVVAAGAPVNTRDDEAREGFRWWQCLEFSIPCGGTHVRDIAEIGAVDISFSQKKNKPKVTIKLI